MTVQPSNMNAAQTLALHSVKAGLVLEARNLGYSLPKQGWQVQAVSLVAGPRQLVALVGPTEGSQTLLLELLAGEKRPAEGAVLVNGVDIASPQGAFRRSTGFVRRSDHFAGDLTVSETFRIAAQLRVPGGLSTEQRKQRIQGLLAELGLAGLGAQRLNALSPVQRKLVAIGVELLPDPGLLYLDQPVSGLTLEGEARLLKLLRVLADQGRTIILTTQSERLLSLADQVGVIGGAGGELLWFGTSVEGLDFFLGERWQPGGSPTSYSYTDVIAGLDAAGEAETQRWVERYRTHPAYQKSFASMEASSSPADGALAAGVAGGVAQAPPWIDGGQAPVLRQLGAQLSRSLKLMARDRLTLLSLLAGPLLVSWVDLAFTERDMYDAQTGSPERILLSLAVLIFMILSFSGFAWIRPARRETPGLQDELRAGVGTLPYVSSKIILVVIFAGYQAAVWTVIHFLFVEIPGGLGRFVAFFITLALLGLLGGVLGLAAAAFSRSGSAAAWLAAVIILIQLPFLPVMRPAAVPAGKTLGRITAIHYAFGALVTASGQGRFLAADPCLKLPLAEWEALTADQKQACPCQSENLINRCDYPGIRGFFPAGMTSAESTASQADPNALRLPVQPVSSPGMTLEEYQRQVNDYTEEIERRWLNLNRFIAGNASNELARSLAIANAERQINRVYARYSDAFQSNVGLDWAALLVFITLLTLAFGGGLKLKESQP